MRKKLRVMSRREVAAFAARMKRFTKRITEADLTAAVNGTAQDIAIGTLPPNAVVLGRSIKIATYFTGGGASTMTCSIGTAAAQTELMAALDVFSTTATAKPLQGTAGAAPIGEYSGVSLVARFTPDAGHTLLALTAGDLTIEIFYAVPDASLVD